MISPGYTELVGIRETNRQYLNNNDSQEFFIRASASSQPMSIKQAHDYAKIHWGR